MAVSLQKGQKISLNKEAGGTLTKVKLGLGWDVAGASNNKQGGGFLGKLFGGGGEKSIDLDASCIMFDNNKQVVDTVWFRQLQSNDGSVLHTGDNRTGDGDGDDEVINVDLSAVPAQVTSLVFTVNSFTGQTFDSVANAFCRIVNANNNQEVARYNLSAQGGHTAMVMEKTMQIQRKRRPMMQRAKL